MKLLIFSLLFSNFCLSQTIIDNAATGVSIPSGWSSVNNITSQSIQQGGYYLVQSSAVNYDYLITKAYSTLNGASSLIIDFDIATYGSGTNSPLMVDMSLDGGGTWTSTQTSGATPSSTTYVSTNVTFSGVITSTDVKFRFYDGIVGDKSVRVKNIVIKAFYPACTPPSIASGVIASVQNCSFTTLTFSNPDPNSYWQTSATGTDFSHPTTSSYNAIVGGDYYVRTFNGVDCWSTSYTTQTVSVINPVSVTTQPSHKSVSVGNIATFSVMANDVVTYQWQLSTDGGNSWNDISGATTANYTIPPAVLGMNANEYRAVLTNNCGSITTSSAALTVQTVTNFKPGELIFVGFDSTGEDSGGGCTGADDKYYMTSLVDIVQGTEFLIVNSRYESGAAANVRTNRWYGSGSPTYEDPGVLKFTWNGSSSIPAGSIISFKSGGSLISTVYDVRINNVISNDFVIAASGSCNLASTSPDQIYIMQGSFTAFGTEGVDRYNLFSGKVLFGLTNGVAWIPITSAVSADTSGGSTRQSRLPDDIECFNIELTSGEGVKYYRNDALHSGSKNLLLGAIMSAANWQAPSNTSCLNVVEDFTSPYTANALGKPFTVTTGNIDGYWTGSESVDWFNCKNWEGLYVPSSTTDVVITDKTNDPVIYASPSKFPNGAESNNLSIDSGSLTMNTANSVLNLYGNWTNNAGSSAFSEGIGTVHFTGYSPQVINNVTPEGTETFYNVLLNNDFNTNISNDLIVNGDLTINAARKLTIASNDFIQVGKNVINNGEVSVQDDASLIQVDDLGTYDGVGVNSITRVVENLKVFDYVYWASPQNGTLFASIPNSRYYEWMPDHANPVGYGYGNWFKPIGGVMSKGKGYIFRVPSGDPTQTVTLSGNPFNTGVITSEIKKGSYTGSSYTGVNGIVTNADDNFNLLGNPYPSAIDAIEFANDNNAVLENAEVSLWRHTTSRSSSISSPYYQSFTYNYTANDYVTYTASGSVPANAFDGKIASGQAFFVRMKDDVGVPNTANAIFNNSQRSRTYNNSQFFRTSNAKNSSQLEKHRIWLDLINSSNVATSQMIGYIEGATNADDFLYEAKSSLLSGFQFYSIIDNKNFKIQGRQLPFNQNDVVPLGVIVPADGKYTIAINLTDGRFNDANNKIYLEDKVTGDIHDLTTSPYQFNVAKGNYTDRFILRFTNQRLSNPDNGLSENSVAVYVKNDFVVIKSDSQIIKSYAIYNVLGQLLKAKTNVNALESEISDLAINNQTVIVKVTLENGSLISKKIIL